MKIMCIGTGSKGNCYILTTDNNKQLVLELGLKYNSIITKIDVDNLQGILVSHNHADHLYGNNLEKFSSDFNVPIISPLDQKYKVNKTYKIGEFLVTPLLAVHNAVCYSYLIRVSGKTILFATDTNVIPKVNMKIDILLGEVNHIRELIEEKTMYDDDGIYQHLLKSYKNHHSLEMMEEYLLSLNYKIPQLYIIHYSKTIAFDKDIVINTLENFADKIEIMEGGHTYAL